MADRLFIAEPTGACRLSLRRFCYGGGETKHRCDATAVIGEDEPETQRRPDGTTRLVSGDSVPHSDPRWPSACGCGYLFADDDQWQVNELPWYEGNGQRFCWGIGSWDGPPGAMIRAPWRDDTPDNGCPAFVVFLPNGSHWCTRDQSSGPDGKLGPQWSVSGIAPCITVSPSIDDRSSRPWHGWIRNGELVPA
jgi:hypothetical protein